jgi:hypothetical protein
MPAGAVVTEVWVPACSGIALIQKGQVAEGLDFLKNGIAVGEAGGTRMNRPYFEIGAGRRQGATRRS